MAPDGLHTMYYLPCTACHLPHAMYYIVSRRDLEESREIRWQAGEQLMIFPAY